MTTPPVTVGLKTAVMVRSGVGNTIGVGDEIKGKLQASEVKISIPSIRSRVLCVRIMSPSVNN